MDSQNQQTDGITSPSTKDESMADRTEGEKEIAPEPVKAPKKKKMRRGRSGW